MKQYFKTHEWIEEVGGGKYQMGISSYAVDQLGDIVFIEEQSNGETFNPGSSLAILESVKAVGDVYAPSKVKLVATNPDLVSNPESMAADKWIVEIEAANGVNLDDLETLDEEDYQNFLETL